MHKQFKHAGKTPTGYTLLLGPGPTADNKYRYKRNSKGQRWVYDAAGAAVALKAEIDGGNLFARLVACYKLSPPKRAQRKQRKQRKQHPYIQRVSAPANATNDTVLELAAAVTPAVPDTSDLVLQLAAAAQSPVTRAEAQVLRIESQQC
jgi:hypothetical protein